MKRMSSIFFTLIAATFFILNSHAEPKTNHPAPNTQANEPTQKSTKPFKPEQSVFGNPLGSRNSYTINSTQKTDVNVQCVFINTADKIANLAIWTDPTSDQPEQTVHLEKGSKTKPFQALKNFHFKLAKTWWCRIYTPHQQVQKWNYCSYFSVSDANIVEYNPFSTWARAVKDKETSYHCRIKKPTKDVSFFYFKPK